jgi:hypothetical protein
MAVPNIFATATSSIPLSQLDTNFATAITLGSTALYLGNTTTSVAGLTLTGSAFNGTVGATTPSTGDFTSVTGTVSSGAVATYTASGANQSIYSRYIGGSPNAANVYVGADTAAGGISGLGGVGLLWNVGNRALAFGTNNALAMSLSTTGALALKDASTSATGVGITFPATQSASTDANTLDDYEEGSWTPTITPGTGSLTTYTSSGTYIKIGKFVFVWFKFGITTAGTASGVANVGSLPFAAASSGGAQATGNVREDNVTGTFYGSYVASGASSITISQFTSYTLGISWTNGYGYNATLVYQTA